MRNVVDYTAAALMREVETERSVAARPEATALIENVCRSISDYWDYLDRHGLIYDGKRDLMRASALHVIFDGYGWDIVLKNGAIDRQFNGGEDPDPCRKGRNPIWPPPSKDSPKRK